MPRINETKLKSYVNKLYRGELARWKKKNDWRYSISSFYSDENRRRRKPPTKSQENSVKRKYKNKCAICSKPYDSYDFQYHHINGDRSKTTTTNLVLLCYRCHNQVGILAKAKLKDYINTHKQPSPLPDFKPPKFKF